jgi:hypothetical protein
LGDGGKYFITLSVRDEPYYFTIEKSAFVHALKVTMKEEGANKMNCGGAEIGDAPW